MLSQYLEIKPLRSLVGQFKDISTDTRLFNIEQKSRGKSITIYTTIKTPNIYLYFTTVKKDTH